MGIKTGHLVYGKTRLQPAEEELLLNRIEELKQQFPESGLSINYFLDVALRVGIDIELSAIRKGLEADKHAEHDTDCRQAECDTRAV